MLINLFFVLWVTYSQDKMDKSVRINFYVYEEFRNELSDHYMESHF